MTSEVSRLVGLLDENRIERFVEVLESVRWCPMPDCSLAVKLPKFLSKRPVSTNSGFFMHYHYDAEVYPNRHGQICPMRVSRVRFYCVNTLKMEQYCGK